MPFLILLIISTMLISCDNDSQAGVISETNTIVMGSVEDAEGKQVVGAKVYAFSHDKTITTPVDSAETEDDGSFEIKGLAAGQYHLEVSKEDLNALIPEFKLEEDQTKDLGKVIINIYVNYTVNYVTQNNITIVNVLGSNGEVQNSESGATLDLGLADLDQVVYLQVKDKVGIR